MYSIDQEPARRRKKPRGYEIASYILMAGGAINLVTGVAVLLFLSIFIYPSLGWVFWMLICQSVFGLIMLIVGISLYIYAQE